MNGNVQKHLRIEPWLENKKISLSEPVFKKALSGGHLYYEFNNMSDVSISITLQWYSTDNKRIENVSDTKPIKKL